MFYWNSLKLNTALDNLLWKSWMKMVFPEHKRACLNLSAITQVITRIFLKLHIFTDAEKYKTVPNSQKIKFTVDAYKFSCQTLKHFFLSCHKIQKFAPKLTNIQIRSYKLLRWCKNYQQFNHNLETKTKSCTEINFPRFLCYLSFLAQKDFGTFRGKTSWNISLPTIY